MSHTSVITGPERRRSWSDEQKLELLAEAFGPGGSVSEAARRADICASLLYRWRQLMRAASTPTGEGVISLTRSQAGYLLEEI
jgi:transposase